MYTGSCYDKPIDRVLIVKSIDENNKFNKETGECLRIYFDRHMYHIDFDTSDENAIWYLNIDDTGLYPIEGDKEEITHLYGVEAEFYFTPEEIFILDSIKGVARENGQFSNADGWWVDANGRASRAEGRFTEANGAYSHAENEGGHANGQGSHVEGYFSIANGGYSHVEGNSCADGEMSHAEGVACVAKGNFSHAEGIRTQANNYHTHTEGAETQANESSSHAEGWKSSANGLVSHAEGRETVAEAPCSHTSGDGTNAANYAATALGKFNKPMTTGGEFNNNLGDAFVIGNGYSQEERQNALRVTYQGDTYSRRFHSMGENYALYIKEWWDGNPNNEDRVGYFVTVEDGKLKIANDAHDIIGVTTVNPSLVGNADEDYFWKYKRDDFGRIILEDTKEQDTIDDGSDFTHVETGNIIPNSKEKIAEDYDYFLQKDYKMRETRPEWNWVGIVGIVRVRDDGTCIPGNRCCCDKDGIATSIFHYYDYMTCPSREIGIQLYTYFVLDRINDNVISIILK